MTRAEGEVSDAEMLKKAVLLAGTNLAQLREGDILNLKDDLWELTGRGCSMDDTKENFLKRLTLDQLGKIQAAFKETFERMATENPGVAWKIDSKVFFVAAAGTKSEPFEYGVYSPDPVDAAMISLINLLIRSRATPEQFRHCPECDSLFFSPANLTNGHSIVPSDAPSGWRCGTVGSASNRSASRQRRADRRQNGMPRKGGFEDE